MTAVLIIVGIIVVLAIVLMVLSNGRAKLPNRIENAWAQIDVQLNRFRHSSFTCRDAKRGGRRSRRDRMQGLSATHGQ